MQLPTWRQFREEVGQYDGPPIIVNAQVDNICSANALVDCGCLSYGLISQQFAEKHHLERIPIVPRPIHGYDGPSGDEITHVARVSLDIGGNWQPYAYFYVAPRIYHHDMILGLPWLKHQGVKINPQGSQLEFPSGLTVASTDCSLTLELVEVSAAAIGLWKRKKDKGSNIEIFAVSLRDIEKALRLKVYTDPRSKLPEHYHDYLEVFDRSHADQLPPLRGPQVDHRIELVDCNEKGNRVEPPWGPLYNMSREELLVLRKTLTEYLEKGFIRVSHSPAAAPVLFVRKPGGGLRFCCDYRALNKLTKKDRYPLPLIHETLERIGKARWFTKLDVIAAFHKIRIAEGDEWLTAFRTRFGLFEWLVTPFGLANAPSTFQRYVNWTLRDFLDDFASAYLDDILVFTSGSLHEHREHVQKVLQRLQDAGLQLDIDKCEFETQSTKYLGFIIEAGKGIRMDPEKVKAIMDWEVPRSVKGVRSFLGFANFYRRFIRDFSEIAAPLTDLTKKDKAFMWTDDADKAFQKLKELFTTAPILVQFDPDRETVVEADSSGWATGGVLSQYGNDGMLRPCAYFSRKNTPAECNYEIHDKELLAIISCLREWESELSSVRHFKIITDHKNLQYFTTQHRLNERQMRWADTLSRYNFTLQYRPGKLASRPDALSRREQDMPAEGDERLEFREVRLLNPDAFIGNAVFVAPVAANAPVAEGEEQPLEQQWEAAEAADEVFKELKQAVQDGLRRFPARLKVNTSIAECELNGQGQLLFRGRRWVPESEPLRTQLIQEVHDSILSGHPGRDTTYAILSRSVYWPGMSDAVRRFIRNCDKCGANTVWRDRRQGLLKPLPIPERKWREIAIDFIEKLPESENCTNLMVIVDRLGKGIILEPLEKLDTDFIARRFIKCFIGQHGIPSAITSDRGKQFVNKMWSRICKLLQIRRRLSTAYHPETDGQTERMNSTIEAYLRMFCNWAQSNWVFLAPMAQLAINGRDSASTGISPFFLDHGYHVEPLQLEEEVQDIPNARTMRQKGENIVAKLKGALEIAQAVMATAQQRQEEAANRHRSQAPAYQPGDKVWLDLRNIRTDRPNKKLDARHAKYTVLERVGSHAYRLDTPAGIHNVFHTMLLRPAADDPFPSQHREDYQPPAILSEDGSEEYHVERITGERMVRRGRGQHKQYRVKWTGYARETWTDAELLEDVAALDDWEALQRTMATHCGVLSQPWMREGGNVTGDASLAVRCGYLGRNLLATQ